MKGRRVFSEKNFVFSGQKFLNLKHYPIIFDMDSNHPCTIQYWKLVSAMFRPDNKTLTIFLSLSSLETNHHHWPSLNDNGTLLMMIFTLMNLKHANIQHPRQPNNKNSKVKSIKSLIFSVKNNDKKKLEVNKRIQGFFAFLSFIQKLLLLFCVLQEKVNQQSNRIECVFFSHCLPINSMCQWWMFELSNVKM